MSAWTNVPGMGSNTGIAAGDAICQARASAASLPNATKFKAWLSDESTNAKDRLASNGPWYRLDGIKVVSSKADLINNNLFTSITYTETGTYMGDVGVWTGTSYNGTLNSGNTCTCWTITTGNANQGDSSASDSTWEFFWTTP